MIDKRFTDSRVVIHCRIPQRALAHLYGEDVSIRPRPRSTNGAANNGQGGNFSKYALWLDRGFIRYDIGGRPDADFALMVGRFDNPFFTTSRMMWEEDIGFDGVAANGKLLLRQPQLLADHADIHDRLITRLQI